MAPVAKPSKQAHGRKASDDSDTPSNNLWVGNLSPDVSESDLMSLFSKYGQVDSITSYASRSYAFVYYKRMEDAKAAVEDLRGTVLRGNPLKIEFAKPAKPCKSLWVSGISSAITKEVLEEEFLKFGKVEEFKFIRDRNTAYVDYFRLEDAFQALKNMNGKRIGRDQIRVDFLRSHPTRREYLVDHRDAREGQFFSHGMVPVDAMGNYYEPTHSGSKRQHFQSFGGPKGDEQPTNVLWIGYPPSVEIDKQMLHNAMILFGEIERIESFPSRHHAFVEFRSVDEARRAKEGLQGRLFNDPRITIMYLSSEITPGKDYPEFYAGVKGLRPDMFNEPSFQPAHMDMLNHNRPGAPNTLSGPGPSSGNLGPNMLMRPFGSQGSFEPSLTCAEFIDSTGFHKLPDATANSLLGAPSWSRSSPAPGMLTSPSPGTKRSIRPVSAAWDVFDANQLPRESKRSRIEAALPVSDFPFSSRKINAHDLGLDQLYRHDPQVDGVACGSLSLQEKHQFSPAEVRIAGGGTSQCYPDQDYIWRGVIAKGGSPVCRARCLPIGKGIGSEIPEVVNCSARTGLDMLTKHYADAIGFDIVYFLPDCEEDFASYTEFLHYLGGKDRAGVARFDNGTTLFLVPPSDFLSKVLNVSGPQRLYGVVLKFPQHATGSTSAQSQAFHSHYTDRHEEKVLQMDHGKVSREDSLSRLKQLAPPTIDSVSIQPAITMQTTASANTVSVSQAGVTLTPELIATLASLLPASSKSSGSETAELPQGLSSTRPSLLASDELDKGLPQGWTHDHQAPDQTVYQLQQVQDQYNPQRQQFAQHQNYTAGLNTSYNSAHEEGANGHVQDPAYYLPQPGGVSLRPLSSFSITSQSGQLDRHLQYEVSQNAPNNFGMGQGTGSLGSYGSSVYPQVLQPVALSNLGHGNDVQQAQTAMPIADNENSELLNKVQQLQPASYGQSQGTIEVEGDKNQRYQSTLQFAANLLLQIQQQQQQRTGTQSGQGSANH